MLLLGGVTHQYVPHSGEPIGSPQAPRTTVTPRHTGPHAICDTLKIFPGGTAFGLAALPPHISTVSGVNRWLDPQGQKLISDSVHRV